MKTIRILLKWLGYKLKGRDIYKLVKCPVCGHLTLDDYYICPHCKWEYDLVLDDNGYSVANEFTIQEYKESYNK